MTLILELELESVSVLFRNDVPKLNLGAPGGLLRGHLYLTIAFAPLFPFGIPVPLGLVTNPTGSCSTPVLHMLVGLLTLGIPSRRSLCK